MTIRGAIEQVGAEGLERHRKDAKLWARFYESCTLAHVQYYLQDYLNQFSLDGTQTRQKYELEVSICLAEGLRRARDREGSSPRIDAVNEQLAAYNYAIQSHVLQPDAAALAIARLNLAGAMLSSD